MAIILIADDEESSRQAMEEVLQEAGHTVVLARDGKEALEIIEADGLDVVITDYRMPRADGLQVLQAVKRRGLKAAVIMVTAFGTVDLAVRAMQDGAFDFITKPLSLDEVQVKVDKALDHLGLQREVRCLREQIEAKYRMVGSSPAMKEIQRQIAMVAPSHSKVLILGENGTGKELVARAIHNLSPRAAKPFVKVNCAAIPEELIESELFGHEKGAFTGALERIIGKFELAHGSTIFLDEIGDMSPRTQAKVLRVLEEGEFQRVGSAKTIQVDARVIAASNKNLAEETSRGTFREDLFHRLSVFVLKLPPLREREGDIALLAEYFLEQLCRENNRPSKFLTLEAMDLLDHHSWPGNVRELRNAIERAVIASEDRTITAAEIQINIIPTEEKELGKKDRTRGLLDEAASAAVSESELLKTYARLILEKNKGNKAKTCQELRIDFKTLQKRLGC